MKMPKASTISDRIGGEIWRSRLGSALRMTFACTIVGCTALHAPPPVRRYLEFPAFSYVTTILVLTPSANLGDTLRGCCHVLYAMIQMMILSILGLQVVGSAHFKSPVAAAGAVAASAFVVAASESSHLMTKRIAFGQLVIVYVSTVIHDDGDEDAVFNYPLHAASSTALGAFAAIFSMLLPYPRLAHFQVKKASQMYIENTSERFNLNLEAMSALDNSTALSFFNQAKSLSNSGEKLQRNIITRNMDGMRWERPRVRLLNTNYIDPEAKLQDKEMPVRGMDIALSTCASFPVGVINEDLRNVLLHCRGKLSPEFDKKASSVESDDAATATESKNKEGSNSFLPWSLENLSIAYKHLPTSFFLYCVQLVLEGYSITTSDKNMVEKTNNAHQWWKPKRIKQVIIKMLPSSQTLVFAFKCSLTLGLAVLFGLLYDTENGYWSGLSIAISFDTRRQATFSVSNVRGQGTAMGSIYGVICSCVFQKSKDIMFLPVLPWVVFCSFLMHSRMYGESGGMAAVIGALLILGREHYGLPAQFAIARITEATIGLTCFVLVEILLNPTRGTSLAKSQLSQSLTALRQCIESIAITTSSSHKQKPSWNNNSQELRERQKKLKSIVWQLQVIMAEAQLEPSFWFLPFHGACYKKMLESLSTMADLLLFVAFSIENITRLSQKDGVRWVELHDGVNVHIEDFKDKATPTLKCLEEITKIKSLRKLEKELKNKNLPCDIESGENPTNGILSISGEFESITGSFLQQLEEMANKGHSNRDEETLRGQILVHYSCLGFCISGLMRETIKIENEVKELVMWENPSSHASLSEIYCKINALRSE